MIPKRRATVGLIAKRLSLAEQILPVTVRGFIPIIVACPDPGIFARGGSRPDCQKAALTTFFFSPQLVFSFTVVYQWFISRKLYCSKVSEGVQHFPGGVGGGGVKHIPRGGGPTFSRGGGSKCLIV